MNADAALFELADFAAPYAGPVPAGFVRDYYPPDQLLEAAAARDRNDLHHWRPVPALPTRPTTPHGCSITELYADLRCSPHEHGDRMFWRQSCPPHLHAQGLNDDAQQHRCQCVGTLVTQLICEPCRWHHIGTDTGCRLAWLDHAWPGWRHLPVVPAELTPPYGGALIPKNGSPNPEDVRAGRAAHAWTLEHYPTEWQVPGAPAIARRRAEHTHRTCPQVTGCYSPFGGFLIVINEDTDLR